MALIDKGKVGGTCLNYGCVPSKTLIYTADWVVEIREAAKLGIRTEWIDIDFPAIMARMRNTVTRGREGIGRAMFTHAGDKEAELAWYNATHRKKIRMDFAFVPHAVFTHPQIASVGLTEEQAARTMKSSSAGRIISIRSWERL